MGTFCTDCGQVTKLHMCFKFLYSSLNFYFRHDVFPENICYATDSIGYVNLMPAYGLNVYSMLKHDTLVLTVEAVKHLEERLLYQLHRNDAASKQTKFKLDQV